MADDEYARLFNARGRQYHAAMERYPHARDDEFGNVVAIAGVRPGEYVADIPCGGGYLAGYLPHDITLWSVDSSDIFADCFQRSNQHRLLQCPITAVPLAAGSLDHVLSVAGLHHVDDRNDFWGECARLLKPGGTLTVGDVRANSRVAIFLDSVVDRYTSTGHRGVYFDRTTVAELEHNGFDVTLVEPRRIAWRAASRESLADFCRLLFGLEGIDNATLASMLASEIGVRDTVDAIFGNGVALDWELMFYRATRR